MTYWVEYSYTYKFLNEENDWEEEKSFDADRFHCRKRDIKKEVEKYVREWELQGETFKDLKVEITDCYLTTDEEL